MSVTQPSTVPVPPANYTIATGDKTGMLFQGRHILDTCLWPH